MSEEMTFKWISFYEELSAKLLSFRNNQKELISTLKNLNIAEINKFIVNDNEISPFAIFEAFNRQNSALSQRKNVIEALKHAFDLTSEIPDSLPDILKSQKLDYFEMLQKRNGLIEISWNLLQAMYSKNEADIIKYYDDFISIDDAGFVCLTVAMYWAFPARYLPCSIEIRKKFESDFGISIPDANLKCGDYLNILKKINDIPKFVSEAVSLYSQNEVIDKNFWLLTWNENNWDWEKYEEWCAGTKIGKIYHESWRCSSKQPAVGDHFFLLKTGTNPKGIIAHGHITETSYEASHYDYEKAQLGITVSYVGIEFDLIQNYKTESILKIETLKSQFPNQNWSPQGSGIQIKCNTAELLKLWSKTIGESEMTDRIDEYKNLLLNTHNLILHGAPGTGKTHLAKDIAAFMHYEKTYAKLTDDEKKQLSEYTGFVQFHPSYDYTDFVEGLRPVNSNNGQIGFERKDGVFKAFCKKSLFQEYKKTIPMTKVQDSSFEIVYKSLLEDVKTGKISSYETSRGSYPLRLKDERLLYRENSPRTESEENIQLMYEYFLNNGIYDLSNYDKNKYWSLISELTDGHTKTIDYPEYGWTLQVLLDRAKNFEMKKSSEYVDSDGPIIENKTNKPFIFIIDEINRGEMSKIFGELFFSIDPGYRGKDGLIKTQYQNLVEEGDIFYDGFYVPENVYIIGTMNDIDRSVESMDFAFRRRFTFKEIKANENLGMLEELDDSIREKVKQTLLSLNNAIWNEESKTGIAGLSSAYHIGGAYFLKLQKLGGDFDKLWEYHLEGLLREYLRGMEDSEESLAQLKNAYDHPETNYFEDLGGKE